MSVSVRLKDIDVWFSFLVILWLSFGIGVMLSLWNKLWSISFLLCFLQESMYKIILLDLRGGDGNERVIGGDEACLMLDGLEGLIVWYDKGKPGCWAIVGLVLKSFREGWIISRGLSIWAICWLSTQQSIGSGNQGMRKVLYWATCLAGQEGDMRYLGHLCCSAGQCCGPTGEGEVLGHREPGG